MSSQEAVAAVQAPSPTWTEADLIRHLGERLPAAVGAMSAPDAAALLPVLAHKALAEEAVMLSAPEWPQVPDCLRRASGESLYIPHGAARYATGAQLTMEERLLTHAQETGAPRLQPAVAAQLLGAEQARLEAQLQAQTAAQDVIPARTGSGLRLDQAAAAFLVLTSARRAEVMAGPAGSGKTRTIARAGPDLARGRDGRGDRADHLPDRAQRPGRGGRDPRVQHRPVPGPSARPPRGAGAAAGQPRSLLVLDEASMMSLADIAAILALARDHDGKVVVTGDHEQLAAVEGGGAMMLLARRQGYVQLAEPQRFTHAWERDATLRLRAGDVTVLAEYERARAAARRHRRATRPNRPTGAGSPTTSTARTRC